MRAIVPRTIPVWAFWACCTLGCGDSDVFVPAYPKAHSPEEITAAVPQATDNEVPWVRFTVADWQCSVLLPSQPEELVRPAGGYAYRSAEEDIEFAFRVDDPPRQENGEAAPSPSGIGDMESAMTRMIRARADRFGMGTIESDRCFLRGMPTIRMTLLDGDLERVLYWQYSYACESNRVYVLSAGTIGIDGAAPSRRFFESLVVESRANAARRMSVAEYLRAIGSESAGGQPRPPRNAVVEIAGVVSALRIEVGEFGVRHRLVALRGNEDEKSDEIALCSMDGAPWGQLSPGCRVVLRAREVGLASGMLVNGEVLEVHGVPCLQIESRTLDRDFVSDSKPARDYGGRLAVVAGLVAPAPDGGVREDGALHLHGEGQRTVRCRFADSADVDIDELAAGDRVVVMGRIPAVFPPGAPVSLADCYLIETSGR